MSRRHAQEGTHRLGQASGPSLRNWQKPTAPDVKQMKADAWVDMGWGRLLFGHTFQSNQHLVDELCGESKGKRDVALYLRDPHVVLSMAPHRLFMDPSHTYRILAHNYRPSSRLPRGFTIRRIRTRKDAEAVNRIYATWHMVTCNPDFMLDKNASRLRTYLIAESEDTGQVIGTVTGVDHVEAFNDPEKGASLWCLAVDPQSQVPGVGEWMVRHLVEHFFTRDRGYVDLSVMHNNSQAIALYEKLGFKRVPVFCVKHKNPINEPLFTPPKPEKELNPYATIIIDEARRRGVTVEVLDADAAYFRMHLGGRTVTCRESLTDLTTAIAMSRCDDKRVTQRLLGKAGLKVPANQPAGEREQNHAFLNQCERLVVKPARGEQGAGISVDISTPEEVDKAVDLARSVCEDVLLEQFVEGEDLRVIVIDNEVIAAAVRKPPVITGTGQHTILQLIDKYNRRRAAATGGESKVPLDNETKRCVKLAGHEMDDVLPLGESIRVRKTANLHTGGTIHDVTDQLHPDLARASLAAAEALEIPVVGLDLMVPDVAGSAYHLIEANERPGLANHEPQPTAEKFLDFLFPQTVPH
ncbi:N-acetylglutaminylglutamine synthetase [Phycisphaerales bacterium AB-hyl4]|uniref:N-acetylglutaminylglutamine synthetase n=1 Tax=Natronomicrosphaera hydrolytica TaxID=3242702 RepID=A0ABV4U0X6_9BACT